MGSDDDGYAVRLKLKHFFEYCTRPGHADADDSPLYIFTHLDEDREEGAALLADYTGAARRGRRGGGGRPQRRCIQTAHRLPPTAPLPLHCPHQMPPQMSATHPNVCCSAGAVP